MKKKAFLIILFIFFLFSQSFANDTDLYILTQMMQQVPPDALIILDLSGSMRWTPAGEYLYIDPGWVAGHYDSQHHWIPAGNTYNCGDNVAYYPTDPTGGAHTTQCDMMNDILLGTQYPSTAQFQSMKIWGDSTCAGPYYSYNATGSSTSRTNCSKVALAKNGIFSFLDYDGSGTVDVNDENALNIRMGYMRFYNCTSPETTVNYNTGCNTLVDPLNTHYSKIYCNSGTSCTKSGTASSPSVSSEGAFGGTPLAASLNEGMLYLNGSKSGDPDAACRQKFVILITDGADTYACNGNGADSQTDQYERRRETVAKARALANAGYYVFVIGFGADMPYYQQNTLNWAAYYGNTSNPDQTHSITKMYTIPYGQLYPSGITQCNTSPTSKSSLDGHYYANTNDPGEMGISGYAFIVQNDAQLKDAITAIRNFIIAFIAQSSSYVAPVVPISQFQQTNSENRLYLAMFKPTTDTFWKGNIKKYGIATTDTSTLSVGDVIDANNQLAMTSQNTIKDTALSYWSSTTDGGEVEKGGVGGILLSRDLNGNPRQIYTYLGTNTNLTDPSNAFGASNSKITPATLNVSTTQEVQDIIKFVQGWDAWDWNKNGITNEKRDWVLGSFIHSRPLVIHYSDRDVIYAGADDGMLHAFDDATGNELWGFIPPKLLPNLRNFKNQLSLQNFVDGSPKAYIGKNQTILIFGERRGGNQYVALDVTYPLAPKFLWEINPNQIIYGIGTTSTDAYKELGQSWSTPILGQVKNGTDANGKPIGKWVAFIGGGYDTNQDSNSPSPSDASGNAVYVVDIMTGNQIWKYSNSNNSAMKHCIPSDIALVDVDGNGLIERLYVGDVGGQIWRFDIGDMSNTAGWTGKVIFTASGKIFYPPDVTLESDAGNYEMIFFGTGDREKPNDTSFVNTLYAIKDKNPATPLTESNDLVDVTQDLLQSNASQTDKVNLLNNLKTKNGWYIRLNQSPGESQNLGEKCDAAALVIGGALYFTTFTPSPASGVCTLGTGQGNVYILQYQTGNALFNLSISNDLGESQSTPILTVNDRSMSIGASMPSGIIITVIGSTIKGFGGVAGGVFSPQLPNIRTIVPINWKTVF